MSQVVTLLLLLALLPARAAESALEVGLTDRAGLLRTARTRVIGERLARLASQGDLAVAMVVERGDEKSEEAPQNADDWLRVWTKELTAPATATPTAEAPDPAAEVAATAPLPAGLGRRGVVHLALEEQAVTLAGTDSFNALIGPEQRRRWTTELIAPALASGDVEVLADALDRLVEELGRAAQVTFDDHTPVVAPTGAPPPVRMQVPRPWLNAGWFVLLPTLLIGGLLLAREGPLRGGLLLGPVALLYAGLFFLLRFNPAWFMVIGVVAVAPALLLFAPPPPAPGRVRPVRWVGQGGFGVTGFGGFGAERAR